jgi:hypothetical protein
MNHTPGPWKLDEHQNDAYHLVGARQDYSDESLIFRMDCNVASQETDANACLIAAAPELLEALHNLVSAVDGNGPVGSLHAANEAARAIIAKAGG